MIRTKRLRIVMVTSDGRQLDRRILLEAESLSELGHEVILIARRDDGDDDFAEMLGRIKVIWIGLYSDLLGGFDDLTDISHLEPGNFESIRLRQARPAKSRIRSRVVRSAARALARVQSPAASIYLRSRSRRDIETARFRAAVTLFSEGQPNRRTMIHVLASVATHGAAASVSGALCSLLESGRQLRLGLTTLGSRSRLVMIDDETFAMNTWEEAVLKRLVYFDPDAIHCHDLPQLLPSVLASKQLQVPLIYDAHEVYPEIGTLSAKEAVELRRKERLLVHKCDELVTVNGYCARHMEEAYGCKPFNVILNATRPAPGPAVDTDKRTDLRERLGLPEGARILMYQGWMAEVGRGLRTLVEAMAETPEHIHLVMMGYGEHTYYQRLAVKCRVADRVHVLGAVPWEELIGWSATADVGIIPYQAVDLNHNYCSPNKLFEFISARLPILANDLPFLRDVVAGHSFGLVRPMHDRASMAKAISEMFLDGDRIIESSRRNLQSQAHEWEWPRQAELLARVYDKLQNSLDHPQSAIGGGARLMVSS
jgi:glycosyltransferase involved in cell wall biosynthesis